MFGLVLLHCACETPERNNPLDPKNSRSERRRVILAEAFVNEATRYSPFALTALDNLAAIVSPEQLVIVEHHLPHPNFADIFALAESRDRYQDLAIDNLLAVPDVFFNGSAIRTQGAHNEANAQSRYRGAVDAELGKSAHFTIEASKSVNGNALAVEAAIARLGDSDLGAFSVLAIAFEDLGTARHHHVARKIFPRQNFNGILAGEKKRAQLSAGAVTNAERLSVVVLVEQTTGTGREVLQVALAD